MRYELHFGESFIDHLDRFSDKEEVLILKKIDMLQNNPYHNSLRTKKLRKSNSNTYESSVNMNIRLIWQLDGEKILIEDVGRHDILKKYG